jgi:arylformamidase
MPRFKFLFVGLCVSAIAAAGLTESAKLESCATSFPTRFGSSSSPLVDLTATISPSLVVFESAFGLGEGHRVQSKSQLRGDDANVSELRFGAHTGTHVDAPRHFARGDNTGIEEIDLRHLNGPAFVVDAFGVVFLDRESLSHLEIPQGATIVLFRTDNTRRGIMNQTRFDKDYVGFSKDGAEYLLETFPNVKTVGIDYVSIAAYDHLVTAHVVLLEAGLVPVEGLLIPEHTVKPGWWMFHCAPLKIAGSDGAPARAWLEAMEF